MAAIGLVALVTLVALVVDVGYGKLERRKAQNAADASALAGAHQIESLRSVRRSNNGNSASAQSCLNGTQVLNSADCRKAGGDPRVTAADFAVANGYPASRVSVSWPPSRGNRTGDFNCIEVFVDSHVPTFFGGVVGVSTLNADGWAVACSGSAAAGGQPPAILALGPCGLETLDFSGSVSTVIGGTVANDGGKVGGSGNTFYDPAVAANAAGGRDDPANRVVSTDWSGSDSSGVVEFKTSDNNYPTGYPQRLPTPMADPLVDVYRMEDFLAGGPWRSDPNFHDLDVLLPGDSVVDSGDLARIGLYNPSTGQFRAGIYYTTRQMAISAQLDGVSAGAPQSDGTTSTVGVTFIHHDTGDSDIDGIEISASNGTASRVSITPYVPGLILFTDEDTDRTQACEGAIVVKVAGQRHTFGGVIYAPNGMVEFSGSDTWVQPGSIIAQRVRINGSNLRINSLDLEAVPDAGVVSRLVN